MMDFVDRFLADVDAQVDGAFSAGAGFMAGELNTALSVQAPLASGGGPPRAATPATPGAIPRRVSGYLQSQTGFEQVGPGRWVFGIRQGPVYSRALETWLNHPFFGVTIQTNLAELQQIVSDRLRGG